jgi:hydrogenase maturation protease
MQKSEKHRMDTLILGIGNPILSDDAVGIRIAEKLKEENPELEMTATSEAGINLLDLAAGYDRLIIIDSIITGKGEPGEVYQLKLEDLEPVMECHSSHGIGIATAFELGQKLGYRMPRYVSIYAVEIKDNTTFREQCTGEIEKSIPEITRQILEKEKLGKLLSAKKSKEKARSN